MTRASGQDRKGKRKPTASSKKTNTSSSKTLLSFFEERNVNRRNEERDSSALENIDPGHRFSPNAEAVHCRSNTKQSEELTPHDVISIAPSQVETIDICNTPRINSQNRSHSIDALTDDDGDKTNSCSSPHEVHVVDHQYQIQCLIRCLRHMSTSICFHKVMKQTLKKIWAEKYITPFMHPVDTNEFSDYLSVLEGATESVLVDEGLEPVCREVSRCIPVNGEFGLASIKDLLPLKRMDLTTVFDCVEEKLYEIDVTSERKLESIEKVIQEALVGRSKIDEMDEELMFQQYLYYAKCLLHPFIVDVSYIWINSILYNSIDSDFGKVSLRHYKAFMQHLETALRSEYASKTINVHVKSLKSVLNASHLVKSILSPSRGHKECRDVKSHESHAGIFSLSSKIAANKRREPKEKHLNGEEYMSGVNAPVVDGQKHEKIVSGENRNGIKNTFFMTREERLQMRALENIEKFKAEQARSRETSAAFRNSFCGGSEQYAGIFSMAASSSSGTRKSSKQNATLQELEHDTKKWMAPFFPSIQHINRPVDRKAMQGTPLTISSGIKDDKIALSYRLCEIGVLSQFTDGPDDRITLHNKREADYVGDCFNSSLDFRGLWLRYVWGDAASPSNISNVVTIDISGTENADDILPTVSSAKTSVNKFLKDMNIASISGNDELKKLRQPDRFLPASFHSNIESKHYVKNSLAAAQVNLMTWLSGWTEWYQAQCGISSKRDVSSDVEVFSSASDDDDDLYCDDVTGYRGAGSKRRRGCMEDEPNVVVLEGLTGTTKTALVHAVSSLHNVNVIELNASCPRSGAIVKKTVFEASQSQRFRSLNATACTARTSQVISLENEEPDNADSAMTIIVFDEVDVSLAEDQNFHSAIIQIAKTTKCPLILTANIERNRDNHVIYRGANSLSKLLSSMSNSLSIPPRVLSIQRPDVTSVGNYLHSLLDETKAQSVTDSDCIGLAVASGGDLRSAMYTILLLDDIDNRPREATVPSFYEWLVSRGYLRLSGGLVELGSGCNVSPIGISVSLEIQSLISCFPQKQQQSPIKPDDRLVANSNPLLSMTNSVFKSSLEKTPHPISAYDSTNHSGSKQATFYSPVVLSIEPKVCCLHQLESTASVNDMNECRESFLLIQIFGKNFLQRGHAMVSSSVYEAAISSVYVQIDGIDFPATIISDSEIRVELPHSLLRRVSQQFSKTKASALVNENIGIGTVQSSDCVVCFSVIVKPSKHFEGIYDISSNDISVHSKCNVSAGHSWFLIRHDHPSSDSPVTANVNKAKESCMEADSEKGNRKRALVVVDDEDDCEVSSTNPSKIQLPLAEDDDDDFEPDPTYDKFVQQHHDTSNLNCIQCIRSMIKRTDYLRVMESLLDKVGNFKYINPFMHPVDTNEFSDYLSVLEGATESVLVDEGLEPVCREVSRCIPVNGEFGLASIKDLLPLKRMDLTTVFDCVEEKLYEIDVTSERKLESIEKVIQEALVGRSKIDELDEELMFQQYLYYAKCLLHPFIVDVSYIWINSILYNSIDSDFGKVSLRHYKAFMQHLETALRSEYDSQHRIVFGSKRSSSPKHKDKKIEDAQLTVVPSRSELLLLLERADNERKINHGAITEAGNDAATILPRKIDVPIDITQIHAEGRSDDLDKIHAVLDIASVGDLLVGTSQRHYNPFDFDIDNSYELPSHLSTKDTEGLANAENEDMTGCLSSADVSDIAASKEGSSLSYWDSVQLFKQCDMLVTLAKNMYIQCPGVSLPNIRDSYWSEKMDELFNMPRNYQDRVQFLNGLCSNSGSRIFRHSTSSSGSYRTISAKLAVDVIPFLFIMLDTAPEDKSDASTSVSSRSDINSRRSSRLRGTRSVDFSAWAESRPAGIVSTVANALSCSVENLRTLSRMNSLK